MQAGIDPAELALPRRPIAGDRMDMAVDQAGRERDAMGVDRRRRARKVEVRGAPDRRDAAIDGEDRVRVENRLLDVAAQHQADVLDRQLRGRAGGGRFVMSHGKSRLAPVWVSSSIRRGHCWPNSSVAERHLQTAAIRASDLTGIVNLGERWAEESRFF